MNKSELVDKIAAATDVQKSTVANVVDATIDEITSALRGREKVQLTGFGTFEARHRAARVARNPRTGAPVDVAEHYAPAFKAGQGLKDAVN